MVDKSNRLNDNIFSSLWWIRCTYYSNYGYVIIIVQRIHDQSINMKCEKISNNIKIAQYEI